MLPVSAFRVVLVLVFAVLFGYTAVVAGREGFGLLAVFFGDIAALGWPGQFNLDFLFYLGLSAFWLAWRHHFSVLGVALGLLGFFGGGLVLTAYLLWASLAARGDLGVLLLGPVRAAR
jgi:hypothetical protein